MLRTAGLVIPIALLELITHGFALNINEPCKNPSGESGRCIIFRECQPLLLIYRKPIITTSESAFIQNSRCGRAKGTALVCCADGSSTANNYGDSVSPTASLPKPNECGMGLSDRIYGGEQTDPGEFPWSALLGFSSPEGYGYHCGGSLINSRYVVTAAHCFTNIPEDWQVTSVRLGEHNLRTAVDCDESNVCANDPVDVNIENFIVHENYVGKSTSYRDDIALIRLTRDVDFSDYIQPICLPISDQERSRNNVGLKSVVAGWGRTENNHGSDVKLKVELAIVDSYSCGVAYQKAAKLQLQDTQLCAGGVRGKSTCNGDSGGPLMLRIRMNYFLYGIVSFGPRDCGNSDVPTVYTSVSKYIDWIVSKMQ